MTTLTNQSLEEWTEETIKDIKEFINWWKDNQNKNQEEFPTILSPGQWEEQFLFFQAQNRAPLI